MPRAELGADGGPGLERELPVTGIRGTLGHRTRPGESRGRKPDHVIWLPSAGLPGDAAEIAPYPGYTEPAVQAGPTIRARLGAGHGAMVTLRRPD